ncbi:MAG: Transposase [Bacteroidetes bacterium]|jgi:REP element-mobilizing transposase RayT|nr:Transposase [Bacteroidota bacterium]
MSTQYRVKDPDKAHYITTTIVDWADVFTDIRQKSAIIESLRYCQQNKGLEIYAWVLMSNHLHMLCRGQEGYNLASIIRDFKKFTAKKIIANIKEGSEDKKAPLLELFSNACSHLKRDQDYKVWQDGYHGVEIFSNKFIYQKLNYIHNNPVRTHIVEKPEDGQMWKPTFEQACEAVQQRKELCRYGRIVGSGADTSTIDQL